MKINNIYSKNYEIDLTKLIICVYKKKFSVLFISIICSLLFYFYDYYKKNQSSFELEAVISIQNPNPELFTPYKLLLGEQTTEKTHKDFNNTFFLNISSYDNFNIFFEQSKSFDIFKAYLKSINKTPKEYFKNQKFKHVKNDNSNLEYKIYLKFPEKYLDGVDFLSKYVEFIKKKTIIEFKNRLKLSIIYQIEHLKNEIEITSRLQKEESTLILDTLVLHKGSKFLTKELLMYEKIFLKLESEKFDYNHAADNSTLTENKTNLSSLQFSLFGFFLGIFLSISVIFFKNYSKLLIYKKN
jgi:LPS O-antigen subunit length determinant protein (WzzB/FepE family)